MQISVNRFDSKQSLIAPKKLSDILSCLKRTRELAKQLQKMFLKKTLSFQNQMKFFLKKNDSILVALFFSGIDIIFVIMRECFFKVVELNLVITTKNFCGFLTKF